MTQVTPFTNITLERFLNTTTIKTVAPIFILLAAIIGAVLLYQSRPDAAQEHIPPIIPLVDATRVKKQQISIPVIAQGNVKAKTVTQLMADVSGRVTDVNSNFDAGAYFKKDDVISRIDNRSYIAAVKRAEASVASAKSAIATEKGRADVALKEWQSRAKNIKRSKDATDLYLRKPQLEEAQARLDSAKADLIQAKVDLEHTVVRAPYDCMILRKNIDIGQSVSPGNAIATVFAVDRAYVRVALTERNLQFLSIPRTNTIKKSQAKVQLQATAGDKTQYWQGKLIRTEGVIDERTRSMAAIIEVQDPYGLLGNKKHQDQPLRIGTFVKATIAGRPFDGLIKLSQAALMPGNKVWIIDEQQILRQRVLKVLSRNDDSVFVSGGLEDGDLVSLTSLSNFVAGTEVRVAPISDDKNASVDSLILSDAELGQNEAIQTNTEVETKEPLTENIVNLKTDGAIQ